MTSHLFSPRTITPAPEENPSRVMSGNVLCPGLLVESVGADRQGRLRTGAFKAKQDTLGCLLPRLQPRACPDSSRFQSRPAHLTVGMTLLNASLFEQVDSTFPRVLSSEHSGGFCSLTKRRRLNATGLQKSTRRRGRAGAEASCGYIWVACCSLSTCQSRFPQR